MLYFENTWRPFKHMMEEVYYFVYEDGRLRVCKDCLKDLSSMKPAKLKAYIFENIKKEVN
jgi:hypothetical protein